MLDFYKYFYRKDIPVHQVTKALDAWLHQHLSVNSNPNPEIVVESGHGLQFIPAFEMLVPHVASIVEFSDPWGEILRVHLEVHKGKWNSDMWDEVVHKEHLPQLLSDFFGVVDSEEDLIVPVIGLFTAQFMHHKNPRRLITYPPCTCRGCNSPICPIRRRRRR